MEEKVLVAILLSSFYVLITCNMPMQQEASMAAQVRCTRRFNVGSCAEHVQPVWTYVAHLQNCTQRLGCKSGRMSNRFPTRNQCIQTCHSLQDLYTLYQASEANNNSALLRDHFINVARSEEHRAPVVQPSYDYNEMSTSDGETVEFHTEDVTPDVLDEATVPDNPDLDLWQGW